MVYKCLKNTSRIHQGATIVGLVFFLNHEEDKWSCSGDFSSVHRLIKHLMPEYKLRGRSIFFKRVFTPSNIWALNFSSQ